MKPIYYVYQHIRVDTNEVFYIGIGTKGSKRKYSNKYKRALSKRGRNRFWGFIVEKTKYKVEIIEESEDRNYISRRETELIKKYGRRDLGLGPLVNFNDGGAGAVGRPLSDEHKRKMSQALTGRKHTEESKKKMSKATKGVKKSKEHIEKIREKAVLEWKNGREYSKQAILAMNEAHKKKVTLEDLEGNILGRYNSIKELKQRFGTSSSSINVCLSNSKVYIKKYIIKYEERE